MTRDTYFPQFDWLRAILAATVMLYHMRLIPWEHAGSLAVQVFFALSGWLIGGLLLSMQRSDLPRFFLNRAVRIWAPYFLALILLVAASLLRDPVTPKWLEFVALKALFVYNLFGTQQLDLKAMMPLQGTGNHFWSVNAEEQFYLVAPLLLVVATFGRSILLWAGIAFIAWAADQYAAIAFGVLASVVARSHPSLHLKHWPILLALMLVSGACLPFAYATAAPLFSICLVLLLARPGQKTKLGAIAGGMSYPLYLNHWVGIFVGNALFGAVGMRESPARHAMALVVNIALAVGLYWWFDRRLLAARNAMYTPERALLAMAGSYGLVCTGLAFGLYGPLVALATVAVFTVAWFSLSRRAVSV